MIPYKGQWIHAVVAHSLFYSELPKCPPFFLTQARSLFLITLKESVSLTLFVETTILFRKYSSVFPQSRILHSSWSTTRKSQLGWGLAIMVTKLLLFRYQSQTSTVKCGSIPFCCVRDLFFILPQLYQAAEVICAE